MPKHFKNYLLLIVIAVMCISVMQEETFYTKKAVGFNTEKATYLNEGWTLKSTGQLISLPTKTDTPPGQTVSVYRSLPGLETNGASICIRSSMENVKIYVDDDLLYNSYPPGAKFIGKTSGSLWNFVRIPKGHEGCVVTIELTSPYPSRSGIINDVLYGSKASIMFEIISHQIGDFAISILIMLMGIVIIGISLLLSGTKTKGFNLLNMGLFALLVGLWFLGESKMMQFFSDDMFLVTNINFLGLLLAPIPFVNYVYNSYESHLGRLTDIFVLGFGLNFLVVTALQFAGVADYFETVPSIAAMIILCGATLLISLAYEIIKYKDRSAIKLLLSSSVLLVGVIMELLQFFNAGTGSTDYFKLGVLAFIIVLSTSSIKSMLKIVDEAREAKYLEKLAYLDLLTQGFNRTAYNRDIKKYNTETVPENLWLAIFDLNNLKYTNDNFGHSAGDKILQNAFKAIKDAFGVKGTCYRIGGDEFAVIFKEKSEGDFLSCLEIFKKSVENQKDEEFIFDIAYGYEKFDQTKFNNFEEFSAKVDELMYIHKKQTKCVEMERPVTIL